MLQQLYGSILLNPVPEGHTYLNLTNSRVNILAATTNQFIVAKFFQQKFAYINRTQFQAIQLNFEVAQSPHKLYDLLVVLHSRNLLRFSNNFSYPEQDSRLTLVSINDSLTKTRIPLIQNYTLEFDRIGDQDICIQLAENRWTSEFCRTSNHSSNNALRLC